MIVLLSDLHFMDGTAGEHNILAKTFYEVMCDIRMKAQSVKASEIKLVFLGDIFDLLRSEKWFDVPLNSRPWGVKTDEDRLKMESHAAAILDAIINHPENKESFEVLSGSLSESFGFNVEPERIYVVGNHDRLCAEFPSIFEKARDAIKASNAAPIHSYINKAYGVFARHGHEYDFFNYEGSSSFTREDYLSIPIGEVITTELIVRLPYTIMKHEKVQELPQDEKERLHRNLQEIESVRPLSSTIKWLFYQIEKNDWLEDIMNDCIRAVVKDIWKIDFVREWFRKHRQPFRPLSNANLIMLVLFLLEKLKLRQIEKVLRLADVFMTKYKDPLIKAASDTLAELDSEFYYAAYGHTHMPVQVPINVEAMNTPGQRDLVYINTGTWIDKYQAAVNKGFINWNSITYTIFYNKEEAQYTDIDNVDFPIFEAWNGALKKQRSS